MRRALLSWVAIGILFATACVLSVTAVTADLYSAGSFVRGYLDALARRDVAAALALPGVSPAAGSPLAADSELLTPAALGTLDEIRILADSRAADGDHIVVVEVSVDSATPLRATFHVQPGPAHLGLFPTWRFATSPLATLSLSAKGSDEVRVNSADITPPAGKGDYLVFVPGLYTVDHESTWLEAVQLPVAMTTAGEEMDAALDIRANAAFRAAASRQVDRALDECAEQQVLQPTGCPFGRAVTDRVAGTVSWSIAEYPVVTLEPGEKPGHWTVTAAQGRAALEVPVQSLFTGKKSTLDATVSISAEYAILLADDGTFTIGQAD